MKTKKILVSTIFASLIYVLFVSFTHNPKDEYEALQQKNGLHQPVLTKL